MRTEEDSWHLGAVSGSRERGNKILNVQLRLFAALSGDLVVSLLGDGVYWTKRKKLISDLKRGKRGKELAEACKKQPG